MARLISLLIGYLIGSILFAFLISEWFLKKDPTKYGSHNPGTANMGAVFGKKFGILTCIGDLAKTLVALILVWELFQSKLAIAYAGLGLILGHCYPIWHRFRGGKGVAVAALWLVFFDWRLGLACLFLALLLTILLKNLTLPPLAFMVIFSAVILVRGELEIGLIFVAATLVMITRFWPDLVDFANGRGKRVDILTSLKRKLKRRS